MSPIDPLNRVPSEIFERLRDFVGFGPDDVDNLRAIAPIVAKHGPGITERFYERLGRVPETAKLIEGRVEALKRTHAQWMASLVGGDYGPEYLESRWMIGMAHVRIGLDAQWVEGVMSFVRTEALQALASEIADPAELARKQGSLMKICDLDLLIINVSYAEDRLDRLSAFTGIKRALIENIIRLPKK